MSLCFLYFLCQPFRCVFSIKLWRPEAAIHLVFRYTNNVNLKHWPPKPRYIPLKCFPYAKSPFIIISIQLLFLSPFWNILVTFLIMYKTNAAMKPVYFHPCELCSRNNLMHSFNKHWLPTRFYVLFKILGIWQWRKVHALTELAL